MGRIEDTYKARDVEEIIDIHLYRPWGYALALGARKLRITPNQISVVGMIVGLASGHMFMYTDPWLNAIGVFLWMLGQALDGADGQLARMTDTRSRLGRMLDGISDSVKFASLYLPVGYRMYEASGDLWVFAVVVFAGLTHSYQSSLADFYRNAYLFFVEKPGKAEFESSKRLLEDKKKLSWRNDFTERFLMGAYITYTRRQERFSRRSGYLYERARELYGCEIPENVKTLYRKLNRKLLKYYNALTTNTRMIVFFASLLLGNFWIFFTFEIIGLNALMILMMTRVQKKADAAILREMESSGIPPVKL